MKLTLDKMVIRSAKEEDATILVDWLNDGTIMKNFGFPHGTGITLEGVLAKINNKNDYHEVLILEIDNHIVGDMTYDIDKKDATISIKICDASFRYEGYGTIFIQMIISYLFSIGVNNIYCNVYLDNNIASHVLEKVGFEKLRINFNDLENQNGVLKSTLDFVMTKERYEFMYLGEDTNIES